MGDWFIVKYHADGTVDVSDGDEVVLERVKRQEALDKIIERETKSLDHVFGYQENENEAKPVEPPAKDAPAE